MDCHALPPEDLPNPAIEPESLCLLQWQVGSLPLAHLGSRLISAERYANVELGASPQRGLRKNILEMMTQVLSWSCRLRRVRGQAVNLNVQWGLWGSLAARRTHIHSRAHLPAFALRRRGSVLPDLILSRQVRNRSLCEKSVNFFQCQLIFRTQQNYGIARYS